MTRINTNVSSLVAQNILGRSNSQLQTALTRLSTGLRINSGKDDPAGLIASENLRADIVSVQKAVSNSERANQVIATADSSLGQVSSLLNDIRGLVTESANTGALSDEQIAANQLQVDSALEALNRIAQTTTFQGKRLLDGSLDFITTAGTGFGTVTDLQIDQANLGATGLQAVNVNVTSAATQASITAAGGFSAAVQATATLDFAAELDLAAGTFNDALTDITIYAASAGSTLDNVDVILQGQAGLGAGNEIARYDATAGTLTVTIDTAAGSTADDVVAAINNQVAEFNAINNAGAADVIDSNDFGTLGTTDVDSLALTAAATGSAHNHDTIVVESGVATGVVYDPTAKVLTITINGNETLANIVTALAAEGTYTGVATAGGDGAVNLAENSAAELGATADTGTSGGETLINSLVLELSGSTGAEVFNFGAGTSINDVESAIDLVSDATGVTATLSGTQVLLESSVYGSSTFVDVNVISEGSGSAFETGLSATRATGDDIVASVNGVAADGDGNKLSINTATLDLSLTVDPGSSTDVAFTITGGGALFQVGPDVVTNQQARIGITSVNTAQLGGTSGLLYQLGKGESAALDSDPTTAALIVEEAINEVTTLRGRLGAFQRTTIETNIAALNDTLINLTEAESSIRDADFAVETANLTRAQILVQSGTSVLAIANQNPQNVLALLR